jgi:leader peptidase (prepilin peptidase) / N-methyltransferase
MVIWLIIAGATGVSLGSFASACAYRIPRGISIVSVPSSCPLCHKTLRWRELLPLVSYVTLRGRCSVCEARISWRYPISELIGALGAMVLFAKTGPSHEFLAGAILLTTVAIAGLIDWDYLLIPNKILGTGLVLGVAIDLAFAPVDVPGKLLAGLGSGALLLAVALVGNWVFRRNTLGMGDLKLAGVIGYFVGGTLFLVSLWIAAVIGLAFGLLAKSIGRATPEAEASPNGYLAGHTVLIPFGSLLAIAGACALIYGNEITNILFQWLTYSR